MEKKFSMDEVNNFLANFKKKRGRKTAEPKKENEVKIEKNNNDKPDDIFGENKTSSIFDNNNNNDNTKTNDKIFDEKINNDKTTENIFNKENNNKQEKIFNNINSNSNTTEELFSENNKNENKNTQNIFEDKINNNMFENQNNDNFNNDIFDNNNKDNSFDEQNNNNNENIESIFNQDIGNNNKNINTFENKEIIMENNNMSLNKKYNNFNNGIVLNNPLLNEHEKKEEDIFEENNTNINLDNNNNNDIFGNSNNSNNIFDSNDNNPQNIFGPSWNNDKNNNNDILFQPKTSNYNKTNNNNNNKNNTLNSKTTPVINNKNNLNIKKALPKPPKINNKFNSPFMNQNKTTQKENSPKNETKENPNDIFNNNDANPYNNNLFEQNINAFSKMNNDIQKNINNEVEKLDDEQTTPPFNDSSNNINENNFNIYQKQINNNNKNLNLSKNNRDMNNNSNYIQEKIDNNLNNEQNTYNYESYSFSGIDQDYILLSDNGGENILINNIYSVLNSYSENQLYDYYFPISYNKEKDLNKLSSLLSIILNNGNELNEPISHIVVYLLKYILENKMNINQINILNNNELKNKVIEILANSITNENKGIITLNNLFNTDILFNSLNNNNNSSVAKYNIINEISVHPLEYIINLFNEKILNKNNLLYIYLLLLNLKENDNMNNIGFEEYDLIFENFEESLYIILKYFNNDIHKIKNICNLLLNSYSPKLNFCHFIILKCILNDYEINNEKYYSKIFVSFLQYPNIEKVLISDIFNFILFNMSSQYKKIIPKGSILIKYKYALIKQNYKKDQKLVLLGQKIYENINQFGLISKNNYFKNYLKDLFYNKIASSKLTNNNIQEKINTNSHNKFTYNNNEEIKEEKIKDNKDISGGGSQGGIFSTLKNAFGFGGNESSVDNNKGIEQKTISEEDKKRMTQEELWKLEHPNEPEIVYDPVIKRYILRGKIYDDQEEVIQKKRIEKPMVPPPKAIKKNINKNNNGEGDPSSNLDTFNQMNNIPSSSDSTSSNNRINNPFNSSQFQKQPRPFNTNQRSRMNNLTNRYAVGYNKK